MDAIAFRILDMLARQQGTELSIKALTEKIAELHGSAYYVNVYNKLQQLAKEGAIVLRKIGNSQIVELNFKEYMITDLLAEVEFESKRMLLNKHSLLKTLFAELEAYCGNLILLRSISIVKPHKNTSLNRAELLFLFRGHGTNSYSKEVEPLRNTILRLQDRYNIKIDILMLTEEKFLDMMSSDEINPVREMISDKVVVLNPQSFWRVIKTTVNLRHMRLRAEEKETIPARISEQDLIYNLARLGYREMGTQIQAQGGRNICLEYIVMALLVQGDARRVEAVPVIMAKNSVNFEVLLFLSQKYGLSERLLGILRVLQEVAPRKDLESTIRAMQQMKIKEIRADRKSILDKLRLYNAIPLT